MLNNIQSHLIKNIIVSSSPILVSLPFTLNGLTKFDDDEPKALFQPPGYVFGIAWPIIYLSLFTMNFLILNDNHINNFFKNIIINDTLTESFLQGWWLFSFRYKDNINGRTKDQYFYSTILMFMLVVFGLYRFGNLAMFLSKPLSKYAYMYIPYFAWINFANVLNLQLFLGYTK